MAKCEACGGIASVTCGVTGCGNKGCLNCPYMTAVSRFTNTFNARNVTNTINRNSPFGANMSNTMFECGDCRNASNTSSSNNSTSSSSDDS
ncbi:hypothetical protein DDB_G0270164 [Dictyostelium discoideum AX4]|uniref:Uncharacterized protein n=1 Tax=Dictyostelium discoideum TaxID=44689 RepID=Q55C89_DICDI|nr:hypothetical protein DDB_G0270164 [Dictyostelium discoideum AX4]EAL72432.1 hypothetical protein DDB_G0270164 [Dictyostelium discoideum AX4]|eukprot:XP_646592.1 hypothetical protein DDB_G0270164 [Dictyostelium discoideum AX4]